MSASFEEKSTDAALIQADNASIEQNDASIYGKEALIEILKKKEVGGRVFSKDAADARLIIDEVDIQQVISSKEVMVILSCQTTKARLVLKMMERNGLIKAIQGKGKRKYFLNVAG